MTEQRRHCSERLGYGLFRHHCYLPFKVERDGKDYCTIHDPEYVKAKNAKLQVKWDAKHAVDDARWAWQAARDKAVAGLTLEELQQVTPEMIRRALTQKVESPKDGETLLSRVAYWEGAPVKQTFEEVKHD